MNTVKVHVADQNRSHIASASMGSLCECLTFNLMEGLGIIIVPLQSTETYWTS